MNKVAPLIAYIGRGQSQGIPIKHPNTIGLTVAQRVDLLEPDAQHLASGFRKLVQEAEIILSSREIAYY
jgi:hypothetical protein